jgi:hypothetical protein
MASVENGAGVPIAEACRAMKEKFESSDAAKKAKKVVDRVKVPSVPVSRASIRLTDSD